LRNFQHSGQSRGFPLEWFLAFTKKFTLFVIRVVGFFINKPMTRLTSDMNGFVNTLSHAGEKPLLTG